MLSHCLHWDTRAEARTPCELAEKLGELEKSHPHALLVTRKTSFSADWDRGCFLCLLDGPSLFQRLYVPTGLKSGTALESRRSEHQVWLKSFEDLARRARAGEPTAVLEQSLIRGILSHMEWEEAEVYPRLEQFLGNSRMTRDLGYEHLGIRRLLPRLGEALDSLRPGAGLSEREQRRSWEKFSLELIHLVEHHIEHEERGAYPLYELLRGSVAPNWPGENSSESVPFRADRG